MTGEKCDGTHRRQPAQAHRKSLYTRIDQESPIRMWVIILPAVFTLASNVSRIKETVRLDEREVIVDVVVLFREQSLVHEQGGELRRWETLSERIGFVHVVHIEAVSTRSQPIVCPS